MGRCTYVRPAASPSVVICCRPASQSYRDPLQRQPIRVQACLEGSAAVHPVVGNNWVQSQSASATMGAYDIHRICAAYDLAHDMCRICPCRTSHTPRMWQFDHVAVYASFRESRLPCVSARHMCAHMCAHNICYLSLGILSLPKIGSVGECVCLLIAVPTVTTRF